MSSLLWLNVLLGLLFFGCWAGIPMWLNLTRWSKEIEARHAEVAEWHAELARRAAAELVLADLDEPGTPAYAEVVTSVR
jgi:hypothetical protein